MLARSWLHHTQHHHIIVAATSSASFSELSTWLRKFSHHGTAATEPARGACDGWLQGFAYVLYESPESARRAMQALDKRELQGRLIHVMPAQKAPQKEEPTEVALSPGMVRANSTTTPAGGWRGCWLLSVRMEL